MVLLLAIACAHTSAVPLPGGAAAAEEPISQMGGPGPAPEPAPAPDGTPADALAPRPFTLEELRAGLPVGTRIRLRIRSVGEPEVEQRWEVTAADDTSCTIASQLHAADGTLLKDEGAGTSTWVELNEHASFPLARTVKESSSITVGAGTFDTWLYTVIGTEAEGGRDFVKRYHFSKILPGPPVSFTIVDGKGTVFEMTMEERSPIR